MSPRRLMSPIEQWHANGTSHLEMSARRLLAESSLQLRFLTDY